MATQQPQKSLKAGAIGSLGAIALGVAMMGPALGIYANLGLVSEGAGRTSPAVFLMALLCILPSAASYAYTAREIPSAGSAYTWLSRAINPFTGMWMGLVLAATYFIAVILQPILFGVFFNELVSLVAPAYAGYGTWLIGVLLSTAIVALLAYPGIELSANGSLAVTILGTLVIVALACTVLIAKLQEGLSIFTSFNPAFSFLGPAGFFKGLVFALLSFVGFSVITTAAEETHSPREVIPRVVVWACVLLGLIWTFCAWPLSLALPDAAWGEHVRRGANPVATVAQA